MDSGSRQRVRGKPLRPERHHHFLRSRLMAAYHEWPQYRPYVAANLRPTWHRLASRYPWDWLTSLETIEEVADVQQGEESADAATPHDAELRAYLDAIDATVHDFMGLRQAGAPVPWARACVHADVARLDQFGEVSVVAYADSPRWQHVRLDFHVTEDYASLSVENHDGTSRQAPDILALAPFSFADWDKLRKQAHALVDAEIDRLRDTFQARYATSAYGPGAYGPRLDGELDRIPLLRAALTATPRNRPTHDEVTWKAIARLAEVIGVDRPRR